MRRDRLDVVSRLLRKDSFALLATSEEVRSAAVFVHGFAGDPLKTWSYFGELILEDPRWRETDIYFLSYASVRDELTLSAGYVRQFLQKILPGPSPDLLKQTLLQRDYTVRTNPGKYERLSLVGHSEGGVVLRSAILEALKQGVAHAGGCPPATMLPSAFQVICDSDLSLFAPALAGARLAKSKGMIANAIGLRTMVRWLKSYSPAMQELQQEFQLLPALREDTTYFAETYPQLSGLRARIAWAHHDDTVSAFAYRHDASWRVLNTTHSSVCKPNDQYLAPLELVLTGIISDSRVAI